MDISTTEDDAMDEVGDGCDEDEYLTRMGVAHER